MRLRRDGRTDRQPQILRDLKWFLALMPPPNLTLKHFILKQQVFDLYRYAIRASRGTLLMIFIVAGVLTSSKPAISDPVTRQETVAWIRSEFEHNKHITDVVGSHFIPITVQSVHNVCGRL